MYLPANGWLWHPFSTMPAAADHNVVYLGGTAQTGLGNGSWAEWQLAGYDANGVNADPLLVNVTPGFEDLRLQVGSPARDLIPTSTLTQDAFGNPRPMGLRYDAGAHEYPEPEIEVSLGSTGITSGGAIHLGNVYTVGEGRAFTIHNPHPADLLLTGTPAVALIPGANCDIATGVATQPGLVVIPGAGSTTFTLWIDPATTGPFGLHVSIDNNDADESPFTFTLTGTGVINAPAQANPAPGSSFSGAASPFTLDAAPGVVLSNADISLTDAEGDTITVTAITPPATMPTGITGPSPPPPGHPLTLTWTGVANAANPPGVYTWAIEFEDSLSGIGATCSATINILDLPPTHVPAGTTTGNGSAGTPYRREFTQGGTGAVSVDLATVTDPNTSQPLSLGSITPGGSNPSGGAGIVLSLAGGLLTATPGGTLVDADRGTHTFDVEVTDGTNTVTIAVEIEVLGIPPSFTSVPVTTAVPGSPYLYTVTAYGSPTPTLAVTSTLPAWLSFNAATGELAGTPGNVDARKTFTVTLTATNSMMPVAVQTFAIEVDRSPDAKPGESEESGCAHTGNAGRTMLWFALLALGVALRFHTRPAKHP